MDSGGSWAPRSRPIPRSQPALYLHGFTNTRMGSGHWNEAGHALAAELLGKTLFKDPHGPPRQ